MHCLPRLRRSFSPEDQDVIDSAQIYVDPPIDSDDTDCDSEDEAVADVNQLSGSQLRAEATAVICVQGEDIELGDFVRAHYIEPMP